MAESELFVPKYLKEISEGFDLKEIENLKEIKKGIKNWIHLIRSKEIYSQSESQLEQDFNQLVFQKILGYTSKVENSSNWNFDSKFTTDIDGTSADAYLGEFSSESKKVNIIIELKDAKTDLDKKQNRINDKRTPVEQGFSYVPKFKNKSVKWVIVSNFIELRLYYFNDITRYENFDIGILDQDSELEKFIFLLHKNRLTHPSGKSFTEQKYIERQEKEEEISEEFYQKFKTARSSLFSHLVENNPHKPELLLFEKTQKILDRLIFIFFCEDVRLLPQYITNLIIKSSERVIFKTGEDLWNELKKLFIAIDKGNSSLKINNYNGGLFKPDNELDSLHVSDLVLKKILLLSEYDFSSDLNVNILGKIFENSVSDIEETKATIRGETIKKGARAKDVFGIVYTPPHITHFIVSEAIGRWLEDKKKILGYFELPDLLKKDFDSIKRGKRGKDKGKILANDKVNKHREFWSKYKIVLSEIKIIDPACGSGAFLIEAFDYLFKEGEKVNKEIAKLNLDQREIFDLRKEILSNNIYGVDINSESVEISKLSLWLKTANSQDKLVSLDKNILVGNSLVDDSEVAESLAFKWEVQFAEIMKNGGFDIVIGNPPYDVLSIKETANPNTDKFLKWFKEHELYSQTMKGKTNVYKLFIAKGVSILKKDGFFSFIVPMSLAGDSQASPVRRFLFNNTNIEFLECFPQKDNPKKRVFKSAKISTLIFCVNKKENEKEFHVRSHPENRIESDIEGSILATKADIFSFDKENLVIPSSTNKDWVLMKKILNHDYLRPLGDYAKQYQGEVNETNERKRNSLTKDSNCPLILRGANITMFAVRDASQGEVYFLDDINFLSGKKRESKAYHYQQERIGFQRSSPQNNFRRIIAAPIDKNLFCFDTVSYVTKESSKLDLDCLLIILNSNLYDWYFRCISTNSKVNEYQFDILPFINFEELKLENLDYKADNYVETVVVISEFITKEKRIPLELFKILKLWCLKIQGIEQKRKLASRKERSKLDPKSQEIMRYSNSLIYSMFQLDRNEQKYIDSRLNEML